ncbi:MAG: hypothetical protein ISEC1_P1729 [Thiomicrorhabdus sp.]|nr:MAG: hypothetical protein ISEC1_P1729 [Thiomicrorhabdus sp.]
MKLLICDDHELYRDGLKQLLSSHFKDQNLEIHEAANMNNVYNICQQQSFNLILLDLSMPNSLGVLGLNKVKKDIAYPVAIISADDRLETIQTAFDQGVLGYIPKTYSSVQILRSIELMLEGKPDFPKKLTLCQKEKKKTISPKQRLVLQHLIDGYSNREIAENLYLSEGTVKQYVSALLTHLNVENRTQAAIKGRRLLKVGSTASRDK